MKYDSNTLLNVLSEKGDKKRRWAKRCRAGRVRERLEKEQELKNVFEKTTLDMSKPIQVTININELLIHKDHDFPGSREIYVVTSVFDYSGFVGEQETARARARSI